MIFEVVVNLIVVAWFYVLWRRWKYDLHKIPSPPGLPLPGNKHTWRLANETHENVAKNIAQWWKDLGCPRLFKVRIVIEDENQFECALKLEVGGRDLIYVYDAMYHKECYHDFKFLNKLVEPIFEPASLIHSVIKKYSIQFFGVDWNAKVLMNQLKVTPYTKALRKVYANALQNKRLKKTFPRINDVLDRMITIIKSENEKGDVEVQHLCVQMTLDAVGVVLFEADLGGLDKSRDLFDLMTKSGLVGREAYDNPWKCRFERIFPNCASAIAKRNLHESLLAELTILTDEILMRPDPSEEDEPFWHEIRKLVDPETGKPIQYERLRSEICLAMLAGMEATGHQLAWLLAAIATHPEIQDKLVEEFSERNLLSRDVTFDDLSDLPYLAAVIKEALRHLYVVEAPMIKTTVFDQEILGYRIPKGTWIAAPGTRWRGTKEEWGNPEEFMPERWLTGEDMSNKLYMPFSRGARDCIGQKLAIMELKLATIRMLSRFVLKSKISLEELMNKEEVAVTISAKGGMWLEISPRFAN